MSVITEKSPKHCANEEEPYSFSDKVILAFGCCSMAFFLMFVVVTFLYTIIVWPEIPEFSVKEAQINHLKLTAPSSVNSSIHITLLSINPNSKLSFYFEELVMYASYNGERVTPEASVTPFFLDHGETKLLNTWLVGNQQLVDPYVAYPLQHDREVGKMELQFKISGKLRLKLGKYCISKPYPSEVWCMTIMQFGPTKSSLLSSDTVCDFAL